MFIFVPYFYLCSKLILYCKLKTDWKSKAIEYARDKKRLNKTIREVTKIRDEWEAKSIRHKARADKLEADLKKLKNKLIEMIDIQ